MEIIQKKYGQTDRHIFGLPCSENLLQHSSQIRGNHKIFKEPTVHRTRQLQAAIIAGNLEFPTR